jgi:hypothetical protein
VRPDCIALSFGIGQMGEEVFSTLARAAANRVLNPSPVSMPGKPDTASVSPPPRRCCQTCPRISNPRSAGTDWTQQNGAENTETVPRFSVEASSAAAGPVISKLIWLTQNTPAFPNGTPGWMDRFLGPLRSKKLAGPGPLGGLADECCRGGRAGKKRGCPIPDRVPIRGILCGFPSAKI